MIDKDHYTYIESTLLHMTMKFSVCKEETETIFTNEQLVIIMNNSLTYTICMAIRIHLFREWTEIPGIDDVTTNLNGFDVLINEKVQMAIPTLTLVTSSCSRMEASSMPILLVCSGS